MNAHQAQIEANPACFAARAATAQLVLEMLEAAELARHLADDWIEKWETMQ